MIQRSVSVLAVAMLLGACATVHQEQAADAKAGKPVRVCTQDEGCTDMARGEVGRNRMPEPMTQDEIRAQALEAKAADDPRAAFDLALRF